MKSVVLCSNCLASLLLIMRQGQDGKKGLNSKGSHGHKQEHTRRYATSLWSFDRVICSKFWSY